MSHYSDIHLINTITSSRRSYLDI